jgi:hypothetical protein
MDGGKISVIGGKFLYPVHQMSSAFKSKFLDSLKRSLREQNQLMLSMTRISVHIALLGGPLSGPRWQVLNMW